MCDNIENNPNERELLFELYSFTASNGKIYTVKPATAAEILSPQSSFLEKINAVGIPVLDESGNARLQCIGALSNPQRKEFLSELIGKYVFCGGEPVTLETLSEDNFTVDDIILLVKKLAGISG